MKKYAGVMVVLCVVSLAYGVCGKSFFLFKPSFEFTDPERRVFLDVYGHKGMFEVTVFGGSTCESEKIARYFLPVEQSCIRVIEDGSHNFLSADVTAGYMNVVSVPLQNKTSAQLQDLIGDMTYESVAYFRPKRTEIGVGFAMRYRFSSQCWFTVATSVVQLKHRLNICENIVSTGGPGPDVGYGYKTLWAMINAGCPQWRYGKFYGGCLKKTGFPEVELCLGHDHDHEDTGTTSGFLGVSIPTGSQACQCYMFEPVVGNNRHVGILGGVVGDYGVMQTETLDFRAVLCGLLRYTCPKKELRSFDVRGAPWSRYMLVWPNRESLGNPATAADITVALGRLRPLINYTTLCVDIEPHWSLDVNASVQAIGEHFAGEIGYHAYARQAEELCFCGACTAPNVGLQAFTAWINSGQLPLTRSFATINSPILGADPDSVDYIRVENGTEPTYVRVTTDSLDQSSGLVPATLAQTIYGAFSYQFDTKRVPIKAIIGALYTTATDNSSPSVWKVWGTISLAF